MKKFFVMFSILFSACLGYATRIENPYIDPNISLQLGTTASALTTETNNRISQDNLIGGTTQTLFTQINSTGSALTILANSIAVTTPTFLLKSGGIMTGGIGMNNNYLDSVSSITTYLGVLTIDCSSFNLGYNSYNNYNYGIGIGSYTYNNYDYGIAIGLGAYSNYNSGIGIGIGSFNNYSYGVGIGANSYNNYTNGVGIGNATGNNNTYGVGIGNDTYSCGTYGVGIGNSCYSNNIYGVGVGAFVRNNYRYGTSIGAYSHARTSSTALGCYAICESTDSVALGAGSSASAFNTTSIGAYITNTEQRTTKIGANRLSRLNLDGVNNQVHIEPDGTAFYRSTISITGLDLYGGLNIYHPTSNARAIFDSVTAKDSGLELQENHSRRWLIVNNESGGTSELGFRNASSVELLTLYQNGNLAFGSGTLSASTYTYATGTLDLGGSLEAYGVKTNKGYSITTDTLTIVGATTLPVGVPGGTISYDTDGFSLWLATETTKDVNSWVPLGTVKDKNGMRTCEAEYRGQETVKAKSELKITLQNVSKISSVVITPIGKISQLSVYLKEQNPDKNYFIIKNETVTDWKVNWQAMAR